MITKQDWCGIPPKLVTKQQAVTNNHRDVRNVQFKEPDGGEVECHRTPGQQPRTEEQGRSILKKETVNTATGAILW